MNAAVPRPTPSASNAMTNAEQHAVRLVDVREPREPEDRHQLHDAEQPQPAVDADLHHPQAAEQAADHARPQSGVLRDDADVGHREAHVEVERRRERRRHAVAELVEEDEQQHRAAPRASRCA